MTVRPPVGGQNARGESRGRRHHRRRSRHRRSRRRGRGRRRRTIGRCSSTRRASRTSAVRRSGASAGCSSSTPPNSAAWASRTLTRSPSRTGWAAPSSTGPRTPGRAAGPRPTSTSPPARSAPGSASMGLQAVPGRRLGRARRRPRGGPRQLGAPLPHHVGHRPGGRRAVRASGARARRDRPHHVRVQAPRRRPGRRGRHRRRRHRRACSSRPTSTRGAASSRVEIGDFELRAQAVVVTSGGIGGDHDLVRTGLARATRHPARDDGRRRPRPRRRTHAGDQRAGRCPGHQPRPPVGVRRGTAQLGPHLGQSRHPHPAGPVVAVARRDRPAPARSRTSRDSTRSAPSSTCAAPATTTRGSC